MLVSLVIVPVVSLMTKRPDPEESAKMFSCFASKKLAGDGEAQQ
jgi:hypothetical protein